MAKIMTDNSIWDKRWFRQLSPTHKLFLKYLWERSSHAGIIDNDAERFAFELGTDVDVERAIESFNGNVVMLDGGKKLYVVNKVSINQGELKEGYNPHIGIIKELNRFGLMQNLKASASLEQGLTKPYSNSNSKSNSNSNSKSNSKNKTRAYTEQFEEWWEVYPRKVGKKAAFSSYRRCGVGNDVLIPAVLTQIESDDWKGGYIPNPATWLNQGRWEDVVVTKEDEFSKWKQRGVA